LEELEKAMPRLSDEIVALEARLDDASFYARDRQGFDAAMHRMTAARAELSAAEEAWLELEEKREALAKG
jgi:ATP-binding cassette subfamily F protein uup